MPAVSPRPAWLPSSAAHAPDSAGNTAQHGACTGPELGGDPQATLATLSLHSSSSEGHVPLGQALLLCFSPSCLQHLSCPGVGAQAAL